MAFAGTIGGNANTLIYPLTGTSEETVGVLEVGLTLIGSSGPKEQDGGLMDLEVKHIHLSQIYTEFAAAACPFDPNAAAADGPTYDKENDADDAGSSLAIPKCVIWIGPTDEDAGDVYTIAFKAKLARGNRDFTTGKQKYNELTSTLVGQKPLASTSILAAKYGSLVTGADGAITASVPFLEAWLAAV